MPLMRRRDLFVLTGSTALSACATEMTLPGPPVIPPRLADGAFVMPDGAQLPYRTWQPAGTDPWAVVLALHGFNDSRDAWELPAPAFADAGILVYAPDQRGFGEAPGRGLWAGTAGLVDDAACMMRLLRARHPRSRLFVVGESMGGAVLMCLATSPNPPPVDGYVLVAPAVWGRAEMNFLMRGVLWAAAGVVPGLTLSGGPVRVRASDNRAALIRLSTDPLTIRETRVDTIKGLVDLMDAALAAAPNFNAPSLFMYGGHDELVPDRATAATWHGLAGKPAGEVAIAYYPKGFHLLMRDLDRSAPIGDVVAWLHDPKAPLPSGADRAAQAWLTTQQ
jgi:alpha-beta hydrolase superfamily lysophospholipase